MDAARKTSDIATAVAREWLALLRISAGDEGNPINAVCRVRETSEPVCHAYRMTGLLGVCGVFADLDGMLEVLRERVVLLVRKIQEKSNPETEEGLLSAFAAAQGIIEQEAVRCINQSRQHGYGRILRIVADMPPAMSRNDASGQAMPGRTSAVDSSGMPSGQEAEGQVSESFSEWILWLSDQMKNEIEAAVRKVGGETAEEKYAARRAWQNIPSVWNVKLSTVKQGIRSPSGRNLMTWLLSDECNVAMAADGADNLPPTEQRIEDHVDEWVQKVFERR